MARPKDLPMAAVGAAADAARKVSDRIEEIKQDSIDPVVERSADEGRRVLGRIPGAARVLGATADTSRSIREMPGIDKRDAAKLRRIGIVTVDDLWARAGDRSGRQEISGATGIDEDRLSSWAKRADLMQIRSVGPRQAALLELAGVSSLKQLRHRRPDSLVESLEEANRSHRMLTRVPSEDTAAEWIEEADLIVA